MSTLAAATREAQLRAAVEDQAYYVHEVENDPPPDDALSDLSPEERLAVWQGAEQMGREAEEDARLWREDLAAARAAGMLPPWEEMPLPVEQQLIAADFSDTHDPVTYSAASGRVVAILLHDDCEVPLLRVAHPPDGALAVVVDQAAEERSLLAEHAAFLADELPARRAELARRQAAGVPREPA